MRTYPRSGFRSGGTSECTLVPVFVPGEHPPKPPFFREEVKGNKLKGKIVSALFHTFTHFYTLLRNFPPGLFLKLSFFFKREWKEKGQTILHVSCCLFVLLLLLATPENLALQEQGEFDHIACFDHPDGPCGSSTRSEASSRTAASPCGEIFVCWHHWVKLRTHRPATGPRRPDLEFPQKMPNKKTCRPKFSETPKRQY